MTIRCARAQSGTTINGQIYRTIQQNDTVPIYHPCPDTDPWLVIHKDEAAELDYLLSGQLQTDVAALQAGGGGGGGGGEFIPSYEAKQVICLEQNPTTGALQVIDPQPSDKSTCNLVAGSFEETGGSIFALDVAGGTAIGGAILLAWAIAFGFRMVVRAIQETDSERESS